MFSFCGFFQPKSFVLACFVCASVGVLSVMTQLQYHIRSPILRSVYSRMLDDERHRADEHVYVSS